MGRRKRPRQEDEGDDLESYEREWLLHRGKGSTRQQVAGDDVKANDTELSSNTSAFADDLKNPMSNDKSTKDINTQEYDQDKINRLKLKKQRQKERRKEKKAAAASDELAKLKLLEAEKTAQLRRQRELEQKKRSKEKHATQQFRTLPKGVKVLDWIVGKGPMVQHRKKIRVSYTLRAKNHTAGKIIDSSKNFPFRLGKGEVIQGWDIGLEGMKVGGIRRLIVPPDAGYGKKDVGAGKCADLYFEIELLHVAP